MPETAPSPNAATNRRSRSSEPYLTQQLRNFAGVIPARTLWRVRAPRLRPTHLAEPGALRRQHRATNRLHATSPGSLRRSIASHISAISRRCSRARAFDFAKSFAACSALRREIAASMRSSQPSGPPSSSGRHPRGHSLDVADQDCDLPFQLATAHQRATLQKQTRRFCLLSGRPPSSTCAPSGSGYRTTSLDGSSFECREC